MCQSRLTAIVVTCSAIAFPFSVIAAPVDIHRRAPADIPDPSPATISAFRQMGARFGHLVEVPDDWPAFEDAAISPGAKGLPAFKIECADDTEAINLPSCDVAHGLIIRAPALSDNSLATIAKRNRLATLSIIDCSRLTAAGYERLAHIDALQSLCIASPERIPADALSAISKSKSLLRLRIHNCDSPLGAAIAEWSELPKLECIDLTGCTEVTGEELAPLEKITSLRTLRLSRCYRLTTKGMRIISTLRQIRDLSLFGTPIIDDGVKCLAALDKLAFLDIGDCPHVSDQGLAYLRRTGHLKVLKLDDDKQISDGGMANLKELRELEILSLCGCTRITDAGLLAMAPMKSLREIVLSGTSISDKGLAFLKESIDLEVLRIGGCQQVIGSAFEAIGDLKNLRVVDLHGCQNVTDDVAKRFRTIATLRSLSLSGCRRISDRSAEELGGHEALEELDVSQCTGITDAGLDRLLAMRSLKKLSVARCEGISDEGFKRRIGRPMIELDVSFTGVGDRTLKIVAEMGELRILRISGAKVSRDGLHLLKDVPRLRVLDVTLCNRILKEDVDVLRRELPDCLIYR